MTHLSTDVFRNIEQYQRPKAYSYVRFSTKRQAKGDSVQRQLNRSGKYAAEHDLDLQEQFYGRRCATNAPRRG